MPFYHPQTKELLQGTVPEWAEQCDITPPLFDPNTYGCFWNETMWEVRAGVLHPTPEELAAEALATEDQAAVATVKLNPVIQYLVTHTPAECAAYVQTNVTDLASAKTLLKHFAEALCVLSRKEFR